MSEYEKFSKLSSAAAVIDDTILLSWGHYSGELSRVSPNDSDFSWSVLALDGDNVVAGNIFEQALNLSC